METLTNCPVCHSTDILSTEKIPDHFGNGDVFEVMQCANCKTKLTNPRPSIDEIVKYYKSNTYVSHGSSIGVAFDKIYSTIQKKNLAYKKKLIPRYSINTKVLDFGCGAGAFLSFMKKQGFDVTGIEPDHDARAQIDKQIPVHESLSQLNDGAYDVITLYHVLEHVHDLNELLKELKQRLTRNGSIHLALPNYHSYDAQHYDSYWAGYDVPRHLYHFTQQSIMTLAEKHDLKLLASHPMKFDSFYCSLLSEQYKKSKFAPIKAVWHGYRSNLKANRSGEYSSLIYILTN